jgi:hypothetical protein
MGWWREKRGSRNAFAFFLDEIPHENCKTAVNIYLEK